MTVHSDLRKLVDSAKWFATITLPVPTQFNDSAHRFEVEWKNARKQLSDRWADDELASVEALVGGLSYDGGAALMLVLGQHGVTLTEFHDEVVPQVVVHEGSVPRLAPILEARQREIPHIVVETDRAGADITAF
ncbi:MAG: hypothetical protein AAB327_01020, partial [Actinomycetota bacterium]